MTEKIRPGTQAPTQDLVIERIFDAPPDLVFKTWIDPRHVAQWWGPRHFTNPVCELDARPGGAIRIDMRGPGVVYPMKGVFQEVVEPERLVFLSSALEDEDGNPGLEVLTTVTFVEDNGKTKLTLEAHVVTVTPEAAAALDGMEEGWRQSLDRLAEHVERLQGTAPQQPAEPHPALKRLEKLVGVWNWSGRESGPEGEIHGRISFEWLDGGFFLMQRYYIKHSTELSGIEVIGYDAMTDTFPTHIFDNMGNVMNYTWELTDDDLTIWAGQPGSPSHYRGTFSDDRNTMSGRWEWPGGGYDVTGTRVSDE